MTDRPRGVFVAGHRGMLGHAVARYLAERGYEVRTSALRYTGTPDDRLVRAIRDSGAAFIVNCLGRTSHAGDPAELFRANTVFPIHLLETLDADRFLIHASTDGVFSGTRGEYAIDDARDATDVYGLSKILSEVVALHPRATVIRTSIIGRSLDGKHGLLAWLLGHPSGTNVPGYVNHIWNGVTTLEWARIAEEIIRAVDAGEPVPDIIQPGTDRISKYDLLVLIRDAFAGGQTIKPVEGPARVDRSLIPTDPRPAMRRQLDDLAAWSR